MQSKKSSPQKKKDDTKKTAESALSFFGSKTVKAGSKNADQKVFVMPFYWGAFAFCFCKHRIYYSFLKLSQDKNSQSKTVGKNTSRSAKVTKEEILLMDDEDWSDDESFAQLLDDQQVSLH